MVEGGLGLHSKASPFVGNSPWCWLVRMGQPGLSLRGDRDGAVGAAPSLRTHCKSVLKEI